MELEAECIEASHTVAYVAQAEKHESFKHRYRSKDLRLRALHPRKDRSRKSRKAHVERRIDPNSSATIIKAKDTSLKIVLSGRR